MGEKILTYSDAFDFVPGKTRIEADGIGSFCFVGFSNEGDVVLQDNGRFIAFPEFDFNVQEFVGEYGVKIYNFYTDKYGSNQLDNGLLPEVFSKVKSNSNRYHLEITVTKKPTIKVVSDD